jgi:hypothetical protein
MRARARWWLVLGWLCLSVVACAPIDRATPVPAFRFEDRAGGDAIPREYGDLVGVTPVEGRQYQVVMWFAQTDDTIVGVRLNVGSEIASNKVLVIPRR